MTTYTITFSDGSTLNDLRMNGDNFISDTELTAEDFEGKLEDSVLIECSDGTSYSLANAELIQVRQYGSEWWFIIRETPLDVIQKRQLEAAIQMLTDCLLEMSELLYS